MQARCQLQATEIANQQLEIIRNLPYANIGTTQGWPSGNIPSSQTITKQGINYAVKITPRYVDDPFDGQVPNDTAPNDYKKVEIQVSWDRYPCRSPVLLSSIFAPKGIETAEGTGTLFIKVFNASGLPVTSAQVQVVNTDLNPDISITDQTDNNGELKIYALPISVEHYKITVTKSGYSTDYTVTPGSLGNSTPIKPDASIIEGEITSISFNIDKLSAVNIFSVNENCSQIGNISFKLQGGKLIGTEPDVYKYSQDLSTNAEGELHLNLEWDTYSVTLNSNTYDLAGSNPLLPLELAPNTTLDLYLVLRTKSDYKLLVTVKDAGSGQPLSGAEVTLTKAVWSETKITGFGTWTQTGWQDGSGQKDFIDEERYWEDDGKIDVNSSPGDVKLWSGPSHLDFEEEFENTLYKDETNTMADWDTKVEEIKLPWTGEKYLTNAAVQSLKINTDPRIISRATLNSEVNLNGQTVDYFLSVDGGNHFEIVNPGETHNFVNQGNDLRWKALLRTDDPLTSPIIQGIDISYTFASTYTSSGNLISSSFDTGHATPTYGTLKWAPGTQNSLCGTNCVKFQIATSSSNTTETAWTFLGPDGTEDTYYTISGTQIWSDHNNQRYIRYKAYLATEDASISPILSDVYLAYVARCSRPGQVFFSDLQAGEYDISVSMTGYTTYLDTVNVSNIDKLEVPLSP